MAFAAIPMAGRVGAEVAKEVGESAAKSAGKEAASVTRTAAKDAGGKGGDAAEAKHVGGAQGDNLSRTASHDSAGSEGAAESPAKGGMGDKINSALLTKQTAGQIEQMFTQGPQEISQYGLTA